MFSVSSKVPRPRLGLQEPIPQLWERLRQRVARELPPDHKDRSVLQMKMDSWSCDAMEDVLAAYAVEKAQAAQAKLNPQIEAQRTKIYEARDQYCALWREWDSARKKVQWLATSAEHRLMQLIPVDWDNRFMMIDTASVVPQFSSVDEAKLFLCDFELSVYLIQRQVTKLNAVLNFENLPRDEKNRAMILKLFEMIEKAQVSKNIPAVLNPNIKRPGRKPKLRNAA
jgi:hypothetical protein